MERFTRAPSRAVEMAAPAMKLTLIIESTQDPAFIPRLIPLLTEMPLAEVLSQPFVASLLPPLQERHKQALELIRSRSEERDGTIFFDITDHPLEGFNKFIPYYLHPNATYSIGLSKSSFRTKVAVGSNPWTKVDPTTMVNLAQVCERYGGGGHARVGAISFSPDKEEQARAAATEIVAELRAAQSAALVIQYLPIVCCAGCARPKTPARIGAEKTQVLKKLWIVCCAGLLLWPAGQSVRPSACRRRWAYPFGQAR